MKKQKTQYTLRVIDSHLQFMEVAYSEEEARKAVAKILLKNEGIAPDDPSFSAKMEEYMTSKLKLVYTR